MHVFALGNDEINRFPEVLSKGMLIEHRHPNGQWETAVIEYGKDAKTGEETNLLCCYTLKNKESYLAGIKGKLLPRSNLRIKLDQQQSNN